MLRSKPPTPRGAVRLESSALVTILLLLIMFFSGLAPGGPDGQPSGPSSLSAASQPAPAPSEPETGSAKASSTVPAPAPAASPAPAPVPGSSHPSGNKPLAGYTIVLDPGHGGRDPGALGVSGRTWEKYNAWFVALDAKALLEQAGATVVLTRTGDVYVTLAERVQLAHRHGADLYISIHNDWNPTASIRGVTTYYWHERSRRLAEVLQAELASRLGTRSVGVLRQPFYVLRNTQMPAVLVELGFLSNREEEARLADPAYRWRAAEAIYRGVLRYLSEA
ncbi:MAG: N-acetylmuramoyl-L-alanine amidase [Bacillota bacterium]|nr:hypothetical protein [Bacillota bacterium]REJ34245.1 MAG: hypothetical protein DIU82_09345 [Bacillota bacterium]